MRLSMGRHLAAGMGEVLVCRTCPQRTLLANTALCRDRGGSPGHGHGKSHDEVVTYERITTDPAVMGGLPCIRGLRFPVATVLAMLADGMGTEDILAEHPDLTAEDIHESLLYTAETVSERELPLLARRALGSRARRRPVRDLGMQAAPDEAVLEQARAGGQILICVDTDFGGLLSRSKARGPVSDPRPAAGRTPGAAAGSTKTCSESGASPCPAEKQNAAREHR
jgi:uncharacterized protein (DUF433 family)